MPSGWQDATCYGSQDGRRYSPSGPRRENPAGRTFREERDYLSGAVWAGAEVGVRCGLVFSLQLIRLAPSMINSQV